MEDPQSTPEDVVNVLDIVRSQEFNTISAEAAMFLSLEDSSNHDAYERLLVEYDTKLSDIFEQEYDDDFKGAPAVISGAVYGTDRDGVILPDPVQLSDETASFEQVSFAEIGGKYVVVFIFETSDEIDALTGERIPEHFIYAEPQSLTKFELYLGEADPFLSLFHESAEQIRDEILSEEFFSLTFEEQKARMLEIAAEFKASIVGGIGPEGNLELEVAQYAFRFDDVPLPIEFCVVVQDGEEIGNWNVPEGRFVGVEFPELEDRTEAFRSVDDLSFAKGSACIVLHDLEAKAKYYVSADEIGAVTANYFGIDEQATE